MAYLIPEIEHVLEKIKLRHSRRFVNNLMILRTVKDFTQHPPWRLRDGENIPKEAKECRDMAIWLCYEYTDGTYESIAKYFHTTHDEIQQILEQVPLAKHIPLFADMRHLIEENLTYYLAYDCKNKCLATDELTKKLREKFLKYSFSYSENNKPKDLKRWFSPHPWNS
jgi:hypothetical protein